MATHTAVSAQTGTVTNAQVDTITFSNPGSVVVVSINNAFSAWVRFDSVDPTVDGDNCFLVIGPGYRVFRWQGPVVKICGDAATAAEYTVEIQP